MGALSCVVLPLDDRPINTSHLVALGAVGDMAIKLPPENLVASHGLWNFEKLVTWLDFQMGWNETAVLSVDMFLYGGLIHSRTNRTSESDALSRLEKLKELICKHDCRVYLSSVLLRLSITVSQQHPEVHWKNIFNYSVLKDKVSQGLATVDELQAVETQIPPLLLEEYLYARKRNSDVNLALIELAEHCDYLLYGQEDCAPFGLHRVEKQKLLTRIGRETQTQQSRIAVLTGADEMNAMLITRAACDAWRVKPEAIPLCFTGLSATIREKISLYEDVTVEQNILAHLKPSPFYFSDNPDDAATEKVCCIGFAADPQPDLYFLQQHNTALPLTSESCVFAATESDAVLDFSFSNGAHPQIIGQWLQNKLIPKAFSGWNTTGNRLGTFIAHLGLITAAKQHQVFQPIASRMYVFMRLLDDYCYQSVVREKLQRICEEKGYNPWALSEAAHKELDRIGLELLQQLIKTLGWEIQVSFHLKWPRLFEADIQIQKEK